MLIKEVNDLCRRAMTGDQSALEELGLDNVTFNHPTGTIHNRLHCKTPTTQF